MLHAFAAQCPPHTIAVYASPPPSPADARNTRYQAGATPYLGRTFTGWIPPASPGAPHPDCRATALVDRIDAAVPRVSDTHPAPAGPADEHALQEAKTLSGRRGQHLGVGSIGAEAGAIGGELLPVDVTLVVVGDHHAPGFLGRAARLDGDLAGRPDLLGRLMAAET